MVMTAFTRLATGYSRPRMRLTLKRPLVDLRHAALGLIALLFSAGASSGDLQPFSSDGCSLFPDRALVGKQDWCRCCLAHDLAYWRGGTLDARLDADRELKNCVHHATGNAVLAELMFAGVRSGGGPYFYTPYRWGYGWTYGRLYTALAPEEAAQASTLEREYLARNPALSCPDHSSPQN